MSGRKLRGILSAVVIANVTLGAAFLQREGDQSERAIELLTKAQQSDFKTNVVGVLVQPDPTGSLFQRVKVVRAKSGLQRTTVLAPLHVAKIESIDDGKRKRTYYPDLNVIHDEAAPIQTKSEVVQRLRFAQKHYTFTITAGPHIAGRATICISAIPKNPELDIRRYYLDEETSYPLRMETLEQGGETTMMFEFKVIDYPSTLDADIFKFQTLPDVKVISYNRPRALKRGEAKKMVGFDPIVPKSLPLGFKVQEMQYNEGRDWKSVKVWLSDGLARATVFQWRPDGRNVKVMGKSTTVDYNGLRLMIVSDLGPKARTRLLDAFVAQAVEDFKGAKVSGVGVAPSDQPVGRVPFPKQ